MLIITKGIRTKYRYKLKTYMIITQNDNTTATKGLRCRRAKLLSAEVNLDATSKNMATMINKKDRSGPRHWWHANGINPRLAFERHYGDLNVVLLHSVQ